MRKVVLYGFVLICVAAASFLGVTPVERKILNPDDTTTLAAPAKVTQVEVTNFPAVQPVSGMVNVGNLTTDSNGRLLVAIQNLGSNGLVLRSTTATYQGDLGGRTGATQKCQAEFPGSHFATRPELLNAHNTRGVVWASSATDHSWVDELDPGRTCREWLSNVDEAGIGGSLVRAMGTDLFNGDHCDVFHSVLCAE